MPDSKDTPDLSQFAETMSQFAGLWQDTLGQWMEAVTQAAPGGANPLDTMNAAFSPKAPTFDPAKVMDAQMALWRDYQALWLNTTARLMNDEAEPVVKPAPGDTRFRDKAWSENPVFDFLKQSYLLNARWVESMLAQMEGLDADSRRKVDFLGRQIVDALAPTNFALTNPVVLKEIAETKGENLTRGLANLMADMKDGRDALRPRQTDMDAFEVGGNIATSPGSVIFQNPFMQLIQYAPTTDRVFKKPLLIVPPWINKFYILDLGAEKSFIRWTVEQGYTVFVVSWVNPDESFAEKSFDEYAKGGILAALDAIEKATGERDVTAIGYCIGGTLLAAVLARMAVTGDERIGAVAFFAAQADFEEAGELRVFTDADTLRALRPKVESQGYLDGAAMATTFNALRANDLIWYFAVNNYLMGKQPPVFDLLFWNADSTRFPARLFFDYIEKLYQENLLAKPGGMTLLGTPVDLSKIRIPMYIQASKDDHIAPVPSVFRMMKLFSGSKRFLLAGSGHIAGVINPPAKNKYQHWTNGKRKNYETFEDWFADATEAPGSWWPDWHKWLARRSGAKVAARVPGDGALPIIEPAPGSYVKVRS